MNDKPLHEYVREQYAFQRALLRRKYDIDIHRQELSPLQLNDILMKMVLSVHSESSELLDVMTNWKMHKQDHVIDRAKALEEYVDLFKFVLNIGVYMGVSQQEFDAAWDDKTNIIWARLRNDFPVIKAGERVERCECQVGMCTCPGSVLGTRPSGG